MDSLSIQYGLWATPIVGSLLGSLNFARGQSVIHHPPLPRFDVSRAKEHAYVRAYLLDALRHFNYFEAEIARIDLAFGRQRHELTYAVRAFTSLLQSAQFEYTDSLTMGVDARNMKVYYNPQIIGHSLARLDQILFHEAMHLMPQPLRLADRIPTWQQQIYTFLAMNVLPEANANAIRRRGVPLSPMEIIAGDHWNFDALRDNSAMQDVIAKALQYHWQIEIEAMYFEVALLGAQTGGGRDAVVREARQRSYALPGHERVAVGLAQYYQPGRSWKELEQLALENVLFQPLLHHLYVALRRAEAEKNATVESLNRGVYEWAESSILYRHRGPTSLALIAVSGGTSLIAIGLGSVLYRKWEHRRNARKKAELNALRISFASCPEITTAQLLAAYPNVRKMERLLKNTPHKHLKIRKIVQSAEQAGDQVMTAASLSGQKNIKTTMLFRIVLGISLAIAFISTLLAMGRLNWFHVLRLLRINVNPTIVNRHSAPFPSHNSFRVAIAA